VSGAPHCSRWTSTLFFLCPVQPLVYALYSVFMLLCFVVTMFCSCLVPFINM
jgi:hypothetical protein